jgi:hypothetical protein
LREEREEARRREELENGRKHAVGRNWKGKKHVEGRKENGKKHAGGRRLRLPG